MREQLDAKYAHRPATVQVHELLEVFPARLRLPRNATTSTKRFDAFVRARGVRLRSWPGTSRSISSAKSSSQRAWRRSTPRCEGTPEEADDVRVYDPDLQDLKESEVIHIARAANITSGAQNKCLERNLQIRNEIAHPSGVTFTQLQAEPFIIEGLVENIVLGLRV